MITIKELAEYFETQLNALIPDGEGYEFKIWAEAGKYKKPYRQSNKVYYFINGQLATNASAVTPNALVMGVNGLTLSFLVPVLPPKTNPAQTDSELAEYQDGQLYFIQQVSALLLQYFTKTKMLSVTDSENNTFTLAMYAGVAISGVIAIYSNAGEAMEMSVSITLNFAQNGVNGLGIKVYMDGELVPYMTLNPSRSGQLSTDVQSNSAVQKHLATSTVYGIQFTCPSATGSYSTLAVYDYIADETENNTAHFIEIQWGEQRDDVYLMLLTAANSSVSGAEFAGLNITLGEAYGNEEYFKFPASFMSGMFLVNDSEATALSFSLSSTFTKTYPKSVNIPDSYPFYCFIAGKAYKFVASKIGTTIGEDNATIVTFKAEGEVTATLTAADYCYSEENDNYVVYLITSAAATVSDITAGFIFNNGD